MTNTKKRQKILIGLAWPYVNGDLHIGHLAGYLLPADIFARFNRFIGNDVLMVSGSDSHGTPIMVEADQKGVTPVEIVKKYHAKHQELFKLLGISFDLYTNTTTENHKKVVQDVFLRLLERNYIFKDTTKQFYSGSEKKFLPDRYVEGVCAYCKKPGARSDQCDNCGRLLDQDSLLNPVSKISGEPVELKDTEHYFLDWPKFVPFLDKYVARVGGGWRKWVLAESREWLREGLRARAITRDLDWGIEIPTERISSEQRIVHAEHKRIYVWFEAVIGYLSASIEWAAEQGRPEAWQDFWRESGAAGAFKPATKLQQRHYYFVGKDNLVFHALFWPAQLHGYDESLHLPDVPVVSQFLTLEGKQFSKSRGVTVDSRYVAATYGADNIRFFLASIAPEQADSIFSWQDFVRQNNSLLIGTIGNFINRSLSLSQEIKLDAESVVEAIDPAVEQRVERSLKTGFNHLQRTEFKKYVRTIGELADFGNKYLAGHEPWKIKKTDPERYAQILINALLVVLALYVELTPLTPEAVGELSKLLGIKIEQWPSRGVISLKKLIVDLKLAKPRPIFSKIDPKVIKIENQKIGF